MKYSAFSSAYSKSASTNHIMDAPQYIQQRMPIFISFCGAFLYQMIVQIMAAKTVVSRVMANIRRKIEANPAAPRYISTEVGVGYMMAEGE